MDTALYRQIVTRAVMTRRYGQFLDWKKPVVEKTIGPCHPNVFNGFNLELKVAIEVTRESLDGLTEQEFFNRFDAEGNVRDTEYAAIERMDDIGLRRIFQQEPVWFAGGFGHPDRRADFKHWTRMRHWSLDETVALSLGFEPCGDIFAGQEGRPVQRDVVDFYNKRYQLVRDNFSWGGMSGPSKNPVGGVVRWFDAVDLEVPADLLGFADRFHQLGLGRAKSTTATPSSNPLDPRERTSMLRLIIALAIGGYGYDPNAERSSTTREIESDVAQLGLRLSIDTIRKHLTAASAQLDQDALDGFNTSKRAKRDQRALKKE